MPTCIVPLCYHDEHSGFGLFRIPKVKIIRHKWIKLIRRVNYQPSTNDRVCGWHFPEGKQKNSLPSRFHWNVGKPLITPLLTPKTTKSPTAARKIEVGAVTNNQEDVDVERMLKDFRRQHRRKSYSSSRVDEDRTQLALLNQIDKHRKEIANLNEKVTKLETEAKDLIMSNLELQSKLKIAETKSNEKKPLFHFDQIDDWSKELLSSLTGFQSTSSIHLLISFMKAKLITNEKGRDPIPIQQQLLVTLVKLRTDLSFLALAYLFQMCEKSIAKSFRSTINSLYYLFYEGEGLMTKIPSRIKNATYSPSSFASIPNCRIVIDCTEVQVEAPAPLLHKKAFYSNYKHRFTAKVLVGCAPNGTATFVSDIFVGGESDKATVQKSGLLDKLETGDLILADKGFEIFDILPPGVELNIPSFLLQNQFSENEITDNYVSCRARVIIERLNARFKVFRMLDCIRKEHRFYADNLIKICIALTNLMPTLMKEVLGYADEECES